MDIPDFKQHSARPVPIAKMGVVEKEVNNLITTGHLEPAMNLDQETFISPAVVTIKKDDSVKIAMDARCLNKA